MTSLPGTPPSVKSTTAVLWRSPTGQAAGIAAAVAVADGTTVRSVDIKKVQDILCDQDVPLPRNAKTDPSYTECCEQHEYGLYTGLAQKARESAGGMKAYRQW